jgi:hypothetical protein
LREDQAMSVPLPESSDPYTPPRAVEESAPAPPGKRPGPAKLLAFSAGLFALTCLALYLGVSAIHGTAAIMAIAVTGFGLAGLLALGGAVRGIAQLARGKGAVPGATFGLVAALVGNVLMTGLGALAALAALVSVSRGRQLRRFGRVLLPRVSPGDSWAQLGIAVEVEACEACEAAPAGLAQQWRENGRTEHASVAAFARLTLDLMALGAPAALIAATNQDARDEIRHAELCFSLARALDGQSASPAGFPEARRARTLPGARTLALAQLAVDSLVDGALNEGVSARIIAKLARRCEVPAIRALLRELGADEGRHAAHGWDVVRFCLAEGGAPVVSALLGALPVLPAEMRSALPAAAADGAWERWGIHGRALEREEYAAARAHIIERVRAMVAQARSGDPRSQAAAPRAGA